MYAGDSMPQREYQVPKELRERLSAEHQWVLQKDYAGEPPSPILPPTVRTPPGHAAGQVWARGGGADRNLQRHAAEADRDRTGNQLLMLSPIDTIGITNFRSLGGGAADSAEAAHSAEVSEVESPKTPNTPGSGRSGEQVHSPFRATSSTKGQSHSSRRRPAPLRLGMMSLTFKIGESDE